VPHEEVEALVSEQKESKVFRLVGCLLVGFFFVAFSPFLPWRFLIAWCMPAVELGTM